MLKKCEQVKRLQNEHYNLYILNIKYYGIY